MAYTRGSSSNIIVGAAALFAYDGPIGLSSVTGQITDAQAEVDLPDYEPSTANYNGSYKETLSKNGSGEVAEGFTNVGYTMNGIEIAFQPDFGEVQVDQVLDVAKLYKQGMQVNLNTAFAEATLENLLFAIAGQPDDKTAYTGTGIGAGSQIMDISAGDLGECPVERGLVAVGPGTGDCEAGSTIERVYIAYRALSIDNVTVSAKRDEATMFEVSFRLLPNDDASYGKIVDRVIPAAS
jgi:hypothetical protein